MAFKNGGLHSVVWRRCSFPPINLIDIAPPFTTGLANIRQARAPDEFTETQELAFREWLLTVGCRFTTCDF